MVDKAYEVYFVKYLWPQMDLCLVFVPVLEKVEETAHALLDKFIPVAAATDGRFLIVDDERRQAKDFAYLTHLAYHDVRATCTT